MYRYYADARYNTGDIAATKTVTIYSDAGSTEVTIYSDEAGSTEKDNPVTVSTAGFVDFYCALPKVWYTAQGSTTAIELYPVYSSDVSLSVMEYGAVGDGVTDDSAAIQDAVDAVAATGGSVVFPAGHSYLVSTQIELPAGCDNRVVISGYGAELASGEYGVFLFPEIETGETYKNIIIEGFDIDCSGMDYAGTVAAIGNRNTSPSADPNDNSFEHLIFRDINFISMASDATYLRYGLSIRSYSNGDGSGEAYIDHIIVDNLTMYNGSCLVEILAGATDTGNDANVIGDNITIRDCSHVRATGSGVQADSFHIGQEMNGYSISISGCRSINCMDFGFEVNNFRNVNMQSCLVENGYNGGYLLRNFRDVDVAGQVASLDNCSFLKSTNSGTQRGWHVAGGEVYRDFPDKPYGSATISNSTYIDDTSSATFPNICYLGNTTTSYYGATRTVFDGCSFYVKNWTRELTGAATVYGFRFHDNELPSTQPTELVFKNCSYEVDGAISGAYTLTFEPFYFCQENAHITVDGMDICIRPTVTSATFSCNYGLFHLNRWDTTENQACTFSADLRNVRVRDGSIGSTTPSLLYVYSDLAEVGRITAYNCDFSGLPTNTHRLRAKNNKQAQKMREINCSYRDDFAPATDTITVKETLTIDEITQAAAAVVRTTAAHGMSTGDWCYIASSNSTPNINGWRQVTVVDTTHFTVAVTTSGAGNSGTCQPAYTNYSFYDRLYVVSGGTVSKIERGSNGNNVWNDTSLVAGEFLLRGGDSLCITNSSAPTLKTVPMP